MAPWFVVVAAQAESLTLATYNLENYTLANRMTPAGYRPEYPKPEAAKAALRAVLHRLDADLLVLQEIGGPPFLAELVRDLAGEGLVYPHAEILGERRTPPRRCYLPTTLHSGEGARRPALHLSRRR